MKIKSIVISTFLILMLGSVIGLLGQSSTVNAAPPPAPTATNPTSGCKPSDPGYPSEGMFFGLVPWYHYLLSHFQEDIVFRTVNNAANASGQQVTTVPIAECNFHADVIINCTVPTAQLSSAEQKNCSAAASADNGIVPSRLVNKDELNVVWLIGLAIFEDLIRVAALIAIGFVIYGGFRYLTSQGQPESTKAALGTIINALIGLAITILAAGVISFIASSLQ